MAAPETPALVRDLPLDGDLPGPDWLRGLRAAAAATVRAEGLPGKRDEAWRFTPTRPILTPTYTAPATASAVGAADLDRWIGADGSVRHGLVDGVAVLGPELPGVVVRSLRDVMGDPSSEPLLEGVLARRAASTHFAALNTTSFTDGLLVRVPRGVVPAQALHIVHVSRSADRPVVSYPRVVVLLEEGATLTLVESFLHEGDAVHLANAVTEVAIGPNASLDHTRAAVDGASAGWRVETLAAEVGAHGRYRSRAFTFGGGFERVDVQVGLAGAGAEATLEGVYHVTDGDLVDHHLHVDHRAPQGTSHQRYRGVLDGQGKAVFDTIARVRSTAPGSAAHQENRNLLMSDQADLHTKPHLEIETDDVSASHGATVGSLDEDAMFYARSRGIGEDAAAAFLTYSFVDELIEGVPHEATRARLVDRILDRLPHGETIRSLVGEARHPDEELR